ncbi:hypothetical protein M2277_001894 [Paenibacillus sp. LBL]|uniref:hypothetical protein n=1 Tax=Paenibacillus TaxID=44249 RepID=UPI0009701ABA|nr:MULTISPECIES: hypothetical protein [Paenibacillus]MDH6671244.1 hypothetical protein [Paenibacillus sp. LBL]OMF72036.1 hypothetical protein BK142_21360 [Paenibacillus glucanolyticus]
MNISNVASWRMMSSTEIDGVFTSDIILVKGHHSDDRCVYFENKISINSKKVHVIFDAEKSNINIEYIDFHVKTPKIENEPVLNAEKLAEFLISLEMKLVIDMTSLQTESLFIILKAFHEKKYDNLVILYVQPQEYLKSENQWLIPNFLLSEEHSPVSAIPGFLRLSDEEKHQMLIVFIGFEGGRFQELCEYLLTDGRLDIVPILPMPSFNAGWHMLGIYSNLDTLKSSEAINSLRRVTAWDPFFALAVLEEQYRQFSENNQIIVAPLGTKPHTLATILFAIKYEDVKVMYDHPRLYRRRSTGIGTTRGFMLNGLFN